MFNFFKYNKQDPAQQEDDVVASVTYLVKQNDNDIHIDVALKDYDDESINSLVSILNILGEDVCYVDTVNIIKSALLEDQRMDILMKLFTKISGTLQEKTKQIVMKKLSDQPCVKPSEMIK
jgi:hypothetical protein